MAGCTVFETSLRELEREITCSVCHQYYTEPKVLPCLHYYCRECIVGLASVRLPEPFPCPECRHEAALPEGGIDELKTAFFVNRLKTTVCAMKRATGEVEAKCEACIDYKEKAEAFCQQCFMLICGECLKQHKRMKPLVSHDLVPLEALKEGRVRPALKESPVGLCEIHEEALTLYCYECSSLICLSCTVKDHRDHEFEFSRKAAPVTREDLAEELKPLKKLESKLSQAIKEIQTTKLQIQEQEDALSISVHNLFKDLHNILNTCKQELLEEAKRRAEEKISNLLSQEKELTSNRHEVESVIGFTEQCLLHGTDNELVSLHTQMKSRINDIKESQSSDTNMEPVEEVDIGIEVKLAEELKQLCQTHTRVIQLPIDLAKSTATIEMLSMAEAKRTSIAILELITRLSNSTVTRRKCSVTARLKSSVSGASTVCQVDQVKENRYSIQYEPAVNGQHEIMVFVDDQEIAGGPFHLVASSKSASQNKSKFTGFSVFTHGRF